MIQPYYKQNEITLYCKDNMRVFPQLPDDSIDLIATDPPYAISFMGRDWDKALTPVATWKECLRVLKAGAFAFIMCSPRQDVLSRQLINLQNAGFDIGFTSVYWAYAEGFTKAGNISKMVDKRLGVEREVIGEYERPDGGKRDFSKSSAGIWSSEGSQDRSITAPATPEAKELDGSYAGFQPKPSIEIIIVAMKPLSEKSYTEQALKNRHGITWLDNGRIPYQDDYDKSQATPQGKVTVHGYGNTPNIEGKGRFEIDRPELKGRFPANLLVSDNVLDDGRIFKSGELDTDKHNAHFKGIFGSGKPLTEHHIKADEGQFSRYFDLDKWWAKTFPFFLVSKPSKDEKDRYCDNLPEKPMSEVYKDGGADFGSIPLKGSPPPKYRNIHPTVKPLKLMTYLVTIGSRPNDIVLDPFVGSGTTAIACQLINRQFIGIDNKREYCAISVERLKQSVMKLNT